MSAVNVQAVPNARPRAIAVASWVLYDLANTIFSINIVSFYFSAWIRSQVGAERADSVYGITAAISYAIIFLVSPLLGAFTDQAPRRMPFLITSTLLCVTLTATLGQGGLLFSLLLFVLANIAYQASLQFYDALLPEVSTDADRGWVGGLGVGVGYLGSFIGLGSGLLLLNQIGFQGMFQLTAALFLAFALPCFFFVRERGNPRATRFDAAAVRTALNQTRNTFQNVRRYPGVARFLIGRVFYTDAVNTVIAVMGLYVINLAVNAGQTEAQATTTSQIILLSSIIFAVLGGLAWGAVVDRIGPKRTLNIVLGVWVVVFVAASMMGLLGLPLWIFFGIAATAGVALGGTWAADRPYMQRISPPARLGEFYGLYGMVGRFSAITGPLLWAGILWLARGRVEPQVGQAIGVLVLLGLILIGYAILQGVSDHHREWSGDDTLE